MTLLTPLGLIGLLGVVALIIIYIIKPNFQQKFISSTYVWKLSLKYRKKKIPTSKLRNVLLILCQILFLTTCAFVLARPSKVLRSVIKEPEVIMIIDSSASMRAETDGKSRFVRAVEEVRLMAEDTFVENGYVTVIVADEMPTYLLEKRMRAGSTIKLQEKLAELVEGETQCSYSSSNVDDAVALCESIKLENPAAKIYLYSDNEYAYVPEEVEYINVCDETEWNGAILDAKSSREENKYFFTVDVASYGTTTEVEVLLSIEGANAADSMQDGVDVEYAWPVLCVDGETTPVLFISSSLLGEKNSQEYEDKLKIYQGVYGENICVYDYDIATYKSIEVTLGDSSGNELLDSLKEDNSFYVYGGMKEVIKVQYASTLPNVFWPAAIRRLRNVLDDRWDIQFTEVKKDEEPETMGYDLYIFEHMVPSKLPEDGVLWLMQPQELPPNMGINFIAPGATENKAGKPLESASDNPILSNIEAENIMVSQFMWMMLDASYETLLFMNEYPMLAVRNDDDVKIVISAFNLHFSNLAIILEFPTLVYNLFTHFFPSTVYGNAFDVNERVEVNSMSKQLQVYGDNYDETFDTFPSSFVVSKPGTYTLKQTNFSGREIKEKIYVRMPKEESNVFKKGDAVADLYLSYDSDEFFKDFLLYLAIGLVTLAFVEWWLRNHESL